MPSVRPLGAVPIRLGATRPSLSPQSRSSSQLDETGVMDTELGSSDPSDPSPATISVADYRRPLDPHELPEVLGHTRRLCETLSYIHGEGVIHRDLKPANVFLPGVDRTVLVDFGLVIAYSGPDGREVMQVAPSLAGTVAYMAPEQLTGELVDARADIFALGYMLYETLTGRIPFPISFRERLQLAAHPLTPPSRFVPWLPPLLDELLAKMLTPDRRDQLVGHRDRGLECDRPRIATPGSDPDRDPFEGRTMAGAEWLPDCLHGRPEYRRQWHKPRLRQWSRHSHRRHRPGDHRLGGCLRIL